MKNNAAILIVEPNNGLLTSLAILLKKHFEKVDATDNIQQAEGLLDLEQFDAILMDLDLFRNKSEALQTVASIKENRTDIEIVLLSTFAQVPIASECINSGCFDFVHKPWNEYEIVISLNNAVTRKGYKLKIDHLEKAIEKYQLQIKEMSDKCSENNMTSSIPPQSVTEIHHINAMTADSYGVTADETLEAIEQRVIKNVMLRNRGNMSLTAQQLGITRQTLYNKIKKWNK